MIRLLVVVLSLVGCGGGSAEDDGLVWFFDCESGAVVVGPLWSVEGCDFRL